MSLACIKSWVWFLTLLKKKKAHHRAFMALLHGASLFLDEITKCICHLTLAQKIILGSPLRFLSESWYGNIFLP